MKFLYFYICFWHRLIIRMRSISSDDDEFDEVGFDYRNSKVENQSKETNGWFIVIVIVASIFFAYYLFDQTHEPRKKHYE